MACSRKQERYNRKAVVYQQLSSQTADTDGHFDESATEYCTRWLKVWPVRGKEQPVQEHQEPNTEWKGELRYDATAAAITTAMWMVLNTGERLNIESIYDPDGRKRVLWFTARQTTA